MTSEERLQRIEHVTAGLADQALRDREENGQLWRDTQRQIDELAKRTTDLSGRTLELSAAMIGLTRQMGELTTQMGELAAKQRDASDTVGSLAQESRNANARVDALTSAIGAWIAAQPKPPRL